MTCKAKTAILATLRQELPLATKKTSTGRLLGIRGVFGDWNQHPLGLVPCCTLAQDLQGWSLPRKLSAMLWRLMAVLRQWISILVAILTGLRSNTDNVLVLCSCIHGEVLLKTPRRELDAMLEHLEEELGEPFKEVSHGLGRFKLTSISRVKVDPTPCKQRDFEPCWSLTHWKMQHYSALCRSLKKALAPLSRIAEVLVFPKKSCSTVVLPRWFWMILGYQFKWSF